MYFFSIAFKSVFVDKRDICLSRAESFPVPFCPTFFRAIYKDDGLVVNRRYLDIGRIGRHVYHRFIAASGLTMNYNHTRRGKNLYIKAIHNSLPLLEAGCSIEIPKQVFGLGTHFFRDCFSLAN